MIHPTAIIHPQAKLGANVRVGPYAVIDADVELGADCVVGPHVYLTGVTKIGAGNQFHAGCVIGDAPQDLKYKDEPTRVVIGDHNVFREHVTVQPRQPTAERHRHRLAQFPHGQRARRAQLRRSAATSSSPTARCSAAT